MVCIISALRVWFGFFLNYLIVLTDINKLQMQEKEQSVHECLCLYLQYELFTKVLRRGRQLPITGKKVISGTVHSFIY